MGACEDYTIERDETQRIASMPCLDKTCSDSRTDKVRLKVRQAQSVNKTAMKFVKGRAKLATNRNGKLKNQLKRRLIQ